ncbi:DUF3943 domain-containing protein [Corallococcus praedator]|uniref:DUF3943 domain-containing protein n=1 Tax=Corallococcus praedator TaxID=2316724 RepID=A0ABX9Q829_9BACT|nr:DUF3943 domain-containing protein [Corallococcus sp. CA047B]RKH20520.1 DUF3943 domain-containing protein [Corallococcus sp. CA031C]RKH92816.1 DUF3943 domain-containing protein [Corallococcus praedator]
MGRSGGAARGGGGRSPWAFRGALLAFGLLGSTARGAECAQRLGLLSEPGCEEAVTRPADAPLKEGPVAQATPPTRHPWRALAEVTAVNLVVWGYDRVVGKEYARVDLHTWKENLRTGFVWDGDGFPENQIAHPYHGSLYFTAARDNGFSYVGSLPFTLLGSLQWELFGENLPPSFNDLINTTLGGAAMGEALYRLSSLVLDTEATGGRRFVRELGAGVLSPVRGFNRVLRGDVSRKEPKPPSWTPGTLASWGTLGYLKLGDGESLAWGEDQFFAEFSLRYGDAFQGEHHRPFDAFEARIQFTTQESNLVSHARLQGLLVAKPLLRTERDELRLAVLQQMSYVDTLAYEMGGQSLDVGLLYRHQLTARSTLKTMLLADGAPLTAISSEHSSARNRRYDYGVGGGFQVQAVYARDTWDVVTLEAGVAHTLVLDGSNGSHQVRTGQLQVDLPVYRRLGLGGEANFYQRHSRFNAFPDVRKDTYQLRVFISVH